MQVEGGICQQQEDFMLDNVTGTLCCPSIDYCCPHSVIDCAADPRAILFQPRGCAKHGTPPRRRRKTARKPGAKRKPQQTHDAAPAALGKCKNLTHLRQQRHFYRNVDGSFAV